MTPRKQRVLGSATLLLIVLLIFALLGRPIWQPYYTRLTGGRTIQQAIDQYGLQSEARMAVYFNAANASYPPDALTLIGFKQEKQLEVWAQQGDEWKLIHTYPIKAASGVAGPKLREGDKQVPEGIYNIESLNPNSSYHLSMKLNYPNAFDLERAAQDGRLKPGTNIFIHGKAASIGCLAMGDPAIEELFTLVQRVGIENVSVLLLPNDPATQPLKPTSTMPAWTSNLYEQLSEAIKPFR